MNHDERAALSALRFNWAPVPDDVWRPLPSHVDGLHAGVVHAVRDGLAEAAASADTNPIGLVLQGQRGSGKTHLLAWLRQRAQAEGGYFFLVSLLSAKGFWESVLASMLDGLARPVPDGDDQQPQLRLLLRRLAARVDAPRAARRAFMGETALTRQALDAFVEGLAQVDEYVARTSQETARALALSASADVSQRDVAESFFVCDDEYIPGERAAWGMRRAPRTPEEIIQELSRLLALTGPTVIAVDQIDVLLAQSALGGDLATHQQTSGVEDPHQALVLEGVAGGLMSLRERTRRTLTVVACIPTSWTLIKTKATDTVRDRFREPPHLSTIKNKDLGRDLVEGRFKASFAEVGFTPPYPTWPVRPEAFAAAGDYTPRQLLIAIDEHIRACLRSGELVELSSLGEPASGRPQPSREPVEVADEDTLGRFDARFEVLKQDADLVAPLAAESEDTTIPRLLRAGLTAWILEDPDRGEVFSLDPPPSAKPDLHARLRLTLDEESTDQVHWCLRAIAGEHHGNAALNRLRRAATAAGLDSAVAKRRLFVLRNGPWSDGAKTQQALAAFADANGKILPLPDEDLRVLTALRSLLNEDPVTVRAWLVARRPTKNITALRGVLDDVGTWWPARPDRPDRGTDGTDGTGGTDGTESGAPAPPIAPAPPDGPVFTAGHDYDTAAPVQIQLEALRKHMTIFAGSGSGKTVLIRRIVEECALHGVSSIVLDPNNDLARLGDGWPEPPSSWGDHDAAKAAEYLAHTDVVIWTPRREAGRPLSFQPLPDFRTTLDDPDEFAVAVEAAVASLVPRALLNGKAAKAQLGQAVLRRAVEHYGRRGGNRLQGLVDTLADLPDGIIELDDADKIGAGLAQALTATMVNDPLFGGTGTPVDPGLLLTPSPGKRARVSVISLVGLVSAEAQQSFVNQLQMALFAWIKKHPAGDRPLLGLLVMDEAQTFAPSGAMTACTQSTLALASQARKYGLGLAFATQSPKGLHNRIPGNAATQFYGLLNAPAQVEAAREMARVKGGDVPDISRLSTGEFYLAAEGCPPRKLRTPLCLSYHPRSPLTTEEVIERARGQAG